MPVSLVDRNGHKLIPYEYKKDENYFVYAKRQGDIYVVPKCSRTKARFEADIAGDSAILDPVVDGCQAYGVDLAEVFADSGSDWRKLPSLDNFAEALKKLILSYYPQAEFVYEKNRIHFESPSSVLRRM